MISVPVVVLTNDNHLWCLRPFMHQFRKYWPDQEVTVYGFAKPEFTLLPTFSFVSIGRQMPAIQWSNALMSVLQRIGNDFFVLMLEDYWLTDRVDEECVEAAVAFTKERIGVLRVDLTADRVSFQHQDAGTYRGYEMVRSNAHAAYLMSFQAGVWDRNMLRQALVPNESPWDTEIQGTIRIRYKKWGIYGTRHHPIKYQPCVRRQGISMKFFNKLPAEDQDMLRWIIPDRIAWF